jgi:molecular chaperone GrpE
LTEEKKAKENVEENAQVLNEQEETVQENEEIINGNEANSDAEETPAESSEDPVEKALAEERAKYEEMKDRFLRSQADFDNYRKRMQKEREEMAKYASRSLLEKLLPAIDNLERAIDSSKQSESFEMLAQGVEMVYRQIMDALREEGAVPLETVGKPFDPHFHQAVMQEESDQYESGIVIEEFQKGYMLKDKLIRPAMVKVST